MSVEGELQPSLEGGYATPVHTSRLAIVAAVSSFLCVFPATGAVGLLFGLFALREIAAGHGRVQGSSLAWAGIFGGLVSCLGWAAVAHHYVRISEEIDAPTAAFLQAWSRSELDGEAAASPGLRPAMRERGLGESIRKELHDRLGAFSGLGERTHYHYRPKLGPDEISATYQLRFENGAPCTGTFDYARNEGKLRVVAVALDSPVLVDLVRQKRNAVRGKATPDLHEFGNPADHAEPEVKSFAP